MHEGGCSCGALRYRVDAVRDAGLCHCPTCRRASGSAFGAWIDADATLLQGAPSAYQGRAFCAVCGTAIWHEVAGTRRVHLGTLDEPAAIAPTIHLVAHEQVPWLRLADLLPFTESTTPTPIAERRIFRGPADPAATRESVIELREITKDNLRAVLSLDVQGHQRRMVAANSVSLAQLTYAVNTPEPADAWARAIYAGETVVGLAQLEVIDETVAGVRIERQPFLWRFMIDDRYQGLGFGRRALELVIDRARTSAATQDFYTSAVPGIGSPYEFYRRAGFEDTGIVDDDEVVLKRAYWPR
jgi:diamine N-acetyltransferase